MKNKEIIICANSLLTCAVFETIYKNFDAIKMLGWTNKDTPLELINENRRDIFDIFEKLLNANEENKNVSPEEAKSVELVKLLVEKFHENLTHFFGRGDDDYVRIDDHISLLCDGVGAFVEIELHDQFLYIDYHDIAIFNQIKNKYKETENE